MAIKCKAVLFCTKCDVSITHIYVYLHVIFNYSAKAAAERETNPIIIDNTHTQSWEMLVYVKLVSVRCHSQTSRCLQSRRISTA